jgi:hypothetical protein
MDAGSNTSTIALGVVGGDKKGSLESESVKYCGLFTPCKNSNIETRSHDYATVVEAVFSPCRAEPSRAVTSRASPRIVYCQATAINTWLTQEWGRVT